MIRIGSVFSGTTACYINGILANFIPQAPGNSIVTIDSTTGQLGWTTDFAAAKVEEQQKKIEQQQESIAELKSTIAQQQKGMEVLTAQLKEQGVQIQKVSAQLEVSKPAAKLVGEQTLKLRSRVDIELERRSPCGERLYHLGHRRLAQTPLQLRCRWSIAFASALGFV